MSKSKGYGKIYRPCRCGLSVNFVLWQAETAKRGRRIYHWANTDGTHHCCSTFEERKSAALRKHRSVTTQGEAVTGNPSPEG